jgi:hypothetical protein
MPWLPMTFGTFAEDVDVRVYTYAVPGAVHQSVTQPAMPIR